MRTWATAEEEFPDEVVSDGALLEEELPEDYVSSINAQINAKFTASAGILQNDYYSTIDDFLFPDSDAGQEQESQ